MNKSYVLLNMCESLKNGESITIDSCCREYKISIPTFRRYISALRDFFWEKYNAEIEYNANEKVYNLVMPSEEI